MKNRFLKYLAILVICISFSCSDNEQELLFTEVPSERVNNKVTEVEQLLLASSEGWKIKYFTDDTILGGFSYIFRFSENGTVEMDSDFGATKDSITTSLWSVDFGATVKLNFDTQNKIHELSDARNIPDNELFGQGYRGSFEFLFYGTEGDSLLFEAARDNTPVVFEKATQEDWDNFNKREIIQANLTNSNGKSIFRTLRVEDEVFDFSYNENRRFSTNLSLGNSKNFGIGFSETGIVVSPKINTSKGIISEFVYNATNDSFEAKLDGVVVASISYADEPAIPLTGYEVLGDFLILHNPFLNSQSNTQFEPDLTNQVFDNFINNLNTSISSFDINRVDLYDLDKNSGQLFVGSTNGSAIFNFNKTIRNNKIFLELTSTNASTSFRDSVKPLTDLLFDPNGLFVDQPTTLNQFSNLVFTFTPASNTSLLFSAVGF